MRLTIFASVLLLSLSGAARADIVFDTGVSNAGTDNVLFNDPASDVTGGFNFVRGHIQGTPTANCASGSLCVDVQSNEALSVNNSGGGQATITAVDNSFALADIFLTIPPGGVYTKIVFALEGFGTGAASQVGFNITATEGNGTVQSSSFTTGSGNTFFTVVAINGQDIRNINLTATNGQFDTLKQLRIGGFSSGITDAPEPTSIALLSSIVAGVALLRKRFIRVA